MRVVEEGDKISPRLTEHQLQKWLTARWLRTGISLGGGT